MKKLFIFKSSSGKQVHRQKSSENVDEVDRDLISSKGFTKSESEVSDGAALRRSLSLSSAFLADGIKGTSSNDLMRSSQNRQRNHLPRCFTPERRLKEAESRHMYASGSLSTCSSNVSSHVLDRFIDGEEHLQRRNKQKSGSSSHIDLSRSIKGKRLPHRVQSPSQLSDTVKDKPKSTGNRLNLASTDSRDASARSLAKSVIERLSHTHGKSSKASSYEPIRIEDVYDGYNGNFFYSNSDDIGNVVQHTEHCEPANEHCADDNTEHQEFFLHGKNRLVGTNNTCKEGDDNSELERKYKDAEKRVKLLSEVLEEQKLFSDRDFDISFLVGDIRQMEEERLGLASEVLSLLRSQVVERASAREEIRRAKADLDLHIKRVDKEKSDLQFDLEKEIDRRSSEWTSKFEKFQLEEKRLRERVRELAEQNVSLQRELSSFHEKETERINIIKHMDEKVTELSALAEELREENSYLEQSLSELQESYTGATEDLHCLRRNFEEKDMECRELQKSLTRFLRTCNEQEKTIQGLRDGLSEEIEKQPSDEDEHMVKKLQMEQLRLVGVEHSLRKEVESMKLEADSLRRENTCHLNRAKANGEEVDNMNFRLDNELKMRVFHLEDQGLSMLKESTQICYKLLKFLKEKLAQFPDTQLMNNGLNEQFLIESEMRVHGIRRGTESLKRSLETARSLLLEKSSEVASTSKSSCSSACRHSEPNNHSVEKSLRAELRTETLITSLLREKLYSMEQEIEQLQAVVAAGVRGNEVLQCQVRNTLDNLSINKHQLKDLKLQMAKKDKNTNRLEINLQEAAKDLASVKVTLPKVLEEREQTWKEARECREKNVDLELENEVLKQKLEKLEEDLLFKEGQITILRDTLGSKQFDLLSSPEFSYNDFLVK